MTTRRTFIKQTSFLLTGAMVGGMSRFSPAAPGIRKNIATLSPSDPTVISYKKAVEVMKQRRPDHPTSWSFQASIHNNACPHGNWFFLPWHRAYLFYFEQICRDASGDPSFYLPYWDWTKTPKVPSLFFGAGNPLADPTRLAGPNDTIPEEFTGKKVIDDILKLPSFEDFGSYKSTRPRDGTGGGTGRLEGTPHNNVHGFVGGDMGAFLSPLDPIFWLHHANVDRLWANWNDNGFQNPRDPVLSGFAFDTTFFDAKGDPVSTRAGEVFDHRQMGYRYDTQNDFISHLTSISTHFRLLAGSAIERSNGIMLEKQRSRAFNFTGQPGALDKLSQIAGGQRNDQAIKLFISDIQPPEKEDFFVRVFIDPEAPVTAETAIKDNPHYAGSFGFFGSGHQHQGMTNMNNNGLTFVLDITNTIRKIYRHSRKQIDIKALDVQLITIPKKKDSKAQLLPRKISVVIAQKE